VYYRRIPSGEIEVRGTSTQVEEFEMMDAPVTNQDWFEVMGGPEPSTEERYMPKVHVSWHDAREFARKVSEQTGIEHRLPTEAEWEHACRAGTTTKYYTGNTEADLSRAAWYSRNTDRLMPIRQKEPNAWNLYDMHGNVWEWCSDEYR